jgi:hypothetical protein
VQGVRQQPRQHHQPGPAEGVVGGQQQPRIHLVGEPARGDRTDNVEDADHGEQPGGGRLGHAVVVRGGDEVGRDQPVGRRPTDREPDGQGPEGPGPSRLHQGADCPPGSSLRRPGGTHRDAVRSTVGGDPQVGGAVAEAEDDQRDHGEGGGGHDQRGGPPAGLLGHPGQDGEEDQLAGGGGGGQDPHDQAAAADEPAVGHDGREHEGHRAGAEADQHAPEQDQLPAAGDGHAQAAAGGDQGQGDAGDGADAEALHKGGGERGGEAEQDQVDADGQGHQAAGPAELLLEGHHQDPGGGPEAGRAEQGHEGDPGGDPGRMEAAAAGDVDHDGAAPGLLQRSLLVGRSLTR